MTINDLRALDIEIAKALGWTVTHTLFEDGAHGYYPTPPNGYGICAFVSEQAAWDWAARNHFEWTKDANTALSLPLPEGFGVELRKFGEMSFARVVNYLEPEPTLTWDTAPTPALAICRAWLAYRAAQVQP